jgi:hypothetical protein
MCTHILRVAISSLVWCVIGEQDSEGRAHSMQHGATGDAARIDQGDADSGLDVSIYFC